MKPSEPIDEPQQEHQELAESVRWEMVKNASMLLLGDLTPLTITERRALRELLEVFDQGPPAWVGEKHF